MNPESLFSLSDHHERLSKDGDSLAVLEALEQALHEHWPAHRGGLVHPSDRKSQYVSIRYSER